MTMADDGERRGVHIKQIKFVDIPCALKKKRLLVKSSISDRMSELAVPQTINRLHIANQVFQHAYNINPDKFKQCKVDEDTRVADKWCTSDMLMPAPVLSCTLHPLHGDMHIPLPVFIESLEKELCSRVVRRVRVLDKRWQRSVNC